MLTAQCHCGNISLTVNETPETLTQCNCSVCNRYGARWAYFKAAQVQINFRQTKSQTYRWGDGDIDFHHCSTCGCVTHYTGSGKPEQIDRIAINTRMCPAIQTASIRIRHFDGADTWSYLN